MRAFVTGLLSLTLCLATVTADDKKTDDKGHEAKITKVDAKNGTLTVKMKDKDGKETEKTFQLAETVRYIDSTGKVAAIDLFKSGDMVLVIEEEGKLKEVHQTKKHEEKK